MIRRPPSPRDQTSALTFNSEPRPPLERVPITEHTLSPVAYPAHYREKIMVDAIHDGEMIPEDFLVDADGAPFDRDTIQSYFVHERDWGATRMAERLARRLGLLCYYRVNTARCLMDFGRFPGTTRKNATHLRRFAINYPFSELLNFRQKKLVLERQYDRISDSLDEALTGRLIKIAVHTYDRYNPSGTQRPQVSLVTRTLGYQQDSEMPFGVFDPIYPDILAEFTVDRVLRDRISLTLEKAGVPVAHNYPYLLPEGSPEVRHQVWAFFHWLQARFEARFPEHRGEPGYVRVWQMLKDTNLRSAEAGTMRSYLHMFRRAPDDRIKEFSAAEDAYRRIVRFVREGEGRIVETYRLSGEQPMSLGIEIRKDLIWEFDKDGHPTRENPGRGLYIADQIARAVATYLREDRAPGLKERQGFEHIEPWYPSNNPRPILG